MTTTTPPRRRRLRWRPILTGLGLLLMLGAVGGVIVARQMLVRPAEGDQSVMTIVVPVQRGDLIELVQVNGRLEPREQARVSFREGVRVAEVLVERGQAVEAGEVLARLETRDLELKVAGARAELDQAQQALDKLLAGPTQAELAMADAAVARARANLAAGAQEVRPIDVEVAKARLDKARQAVADLEAGVVPADLATAQTGLATAQEGLIAAQQSLEETRDTASRAKTDAQQAMERGVQDHEKVQRAYSDAFWDWDYVQRTGRHPTEKVQVDESGRTEHRKLTDREVEGFRRTLADAEVALRNSEQSLKNLSDAFDLARESELRQIATAERAVVTAERSRDDAERTYELASTRGVASALLTARQELAEAEKAYRALVANPERPALQAEREAALLEAIAKAEQLRAGADPAQLAQARTTVEQARAALATAETNLSDATLTAPLAGTVVELTLKAGTLTGANDAVRIADTSGFLIRGQVTEQDVARVKAGQQVQVSIDSVPGEPFAGMLLLVSALPESQGDPNQQMGGPFPGSSPLGGLYPVEIEMQSGDDRLRVGMAATASIEILSIRDTLFIPLQAVEAGETGPTVRRSTGALRPDGQPVGEPIPVELGAISGDQVQILSGLSEGDEVIVPIIPPLDGGFPGGVIVEEVPR